jgi:hypothetical protein
LSIGRAISRSSALSASCEIEEPSGRIRYRRGNENRDALIQDSENASTERSGAMRVVGDRSLEQEYWERASPAQSSDLDPEPSARDRACEIGDCLSLDQGSTADVVVSDGERRDPHGRSESHELLWNAAVLLEHVDFDGRIHHAVMVADPGGSPKVAFLASSGTEEA